MLPFLFLPDMTSESQDCGAAEALELWDIACRDLMMFAMRMIGILSFLFLAVGCSTQPVWRSGFENGFPGSEWLDWRDGSYAESGETMPGPRSAWTIVKRERGDPVFSGKRAYKG